MSFSLSTANTHSQQPKSTQDSTDSTAVDNGVMDEGRTQNSASHYPPVLGFAAYSGTGKTSLLEKLLPALRAHHIRSAIIKHSHHNVEIDHEGKDSYRLRHAGATQLLLASPYRQALISEYSEPKEPELNQLLQQLTPSMADIILVEGFRHAAQLKKIELHRPELKKPLLFPQDEQIIAVATNDLPRLQATVAAQSIPVALPPLLPLDEPATIADFIKQYFQL
ncbi:MAG: molybdopterin-guanine dinucleotide biosynthesis protein B [bacterium]